MDNYEIKLDRRVLKQLGSQLYGDTPSVIAELVANSYDADANNVWITIDTVNCIIPRPIPTGISISRVGIIFHGGSVTKSYELKRKYG